MIPLWNARVFVAWCVVVGVGWLVCCAISAIVEANADARRRRMGIAGFGQTEHNDPLSRLLRWQYRVRVWVLRRLGRYPPAGKSR